MKKVLILSGSPRKNGNSDILCDEFYKGALANGNQVEKIRVAEQDINACLGCYYCRTHNGACVHKDGMADLLQKIIDADVLVLATPVYFYSMCAQLKTVIDRTVARWREIKNKELYYIITSAENERDTLDGTITSLRGFAKCIDGYEEKGILYGRGVEDRGAVLGEPDLMRIAREMGESVR